MSNDSNVLFVLVWDGIVCMHACPRVSREGFCAQVYGEHSVRRTPRCQYARMLVANPLGNGGGISVTMEMSKLVCNKILT